VELRIIKINQQYLPPGTEEGLVLLVKAFLNPSNTLASVELGAKCKRSENNIKIGYRHNIRVTK